MPARTNHNPTLSPKALRRVLAAALILTVLISIGSFVLSFNGLKDLAITYGVPTALAWIWPLIVDGTIIAATMAVVVMPRSIYAWLVLIGIAAISIVGNGVHAQQWGPVGIAIATVPPVLLLLAVHLTVHLAQSGTDEMSAETRTPRPDYYPTGIDESAPDLARNWRDKYATPAPAPELVAA